MPSERTSKVRRREKFVLAMLQYQGVEKAAAAAGISTTTAWRIRKTPEFEAEFMIARRESYSQTIAWVQHYSPAAASALMKIMADPNMPPASRVKAASTVLAVAAKGIELEDIEARVSKLENG